MPFPPPVRSQLCDEAGARCAAPHCRAPTGRPESDSIRNGGDGAHICGENPGSARFDPMMSPTERADAGNGIWLCPSCHRMVDRYPSAYPAELLHEWKRLAQNDFHAEFLRPRTPRGSYDTEAEVRKARSFLDEHRLTVNALDWLLAEPARNYRARSVWPQEDIVTLVRKLGRIYDATEWGNWHPLWCYAPELNLKQQELIRLIRIVYGHPAFALFSDNRNISLDQYRGNDGDLRYSGQCAAAIAAYCEFFHWFEDELNRIWIA